MIFSMGQICTGMCKYHDILWEEFNHLQICISGVYQFFVNTKGPPTTYWVIKQHMIMSQRPLYKVDIGVCLKIVIQGRESAPTPSCLVFFNSIIQVDYRILSLL